jgi:hypothetical protein
MYSWVGWLAYCPDPEVHPTEPLEVVVRRALAASIRARTGQPHASSAAQRVTRSKFVPVAALMRTDLETKRPLTRRTDGARYGITRRTNIYIDDHAARELHSDRLFRRARDAREAERRHHRGRRSC